MENTRFYVVEVADEVYEVWNNYSNSLKEIEEAGNVLFDASDGKTCNMWIIRRKQEENLSSRLEQLKTELKAAYNLNDKQASLVVSKCYEEGHSAGFEEISNYADDFANFARDILDAEEK